MKIELLYGRNVLSCEMPERARVHVIEKPPFPPSPAPQLQIAEALARPMGSAPLAELARGRQSACILICDITRPVPNHLFLRPMIEQMMAAGIAKERITVLVATGLHRPNEGDELAELVGDRWVLDNVRVENHFAVVSQPRESPSKLWERDGSLGQWRCGEFS